MCAVAAAMNASAHGEGDALATYILRRLIATIPVLLLVTFGAFALIRIIPGDLATLKLGQDATPLEIKEY